MSVKGDQQTLKREAEAIIALVMSDTTASVCTACGTKQISEARFCRICGAPNAGGDPAELEVLRLTSGARAGHHFITTGAVWAAVSLLVALIFIFLGSNPVGFVAGLILTQVVVGLFILFLGVLRLNRSLNPKQLSQSAGLPVSVPRVGSTDEATAFLSASTQVSVTEGTTSLLGEKLKEREKEHLYRKKRDTSPLD